MKKVVRLTEGQLSELVQKILSEDYSLVDLPNCSKKGADELNGTKIVKHEVPNTDRLAAISNSFNKQINRGVELYVVKNNKPFCKIR